MSDIYPYAGFWKRAGAYIVDSAIMAAANMLIQPVLQIGHATLAGIIISPLIPILYFAIMESSEMQATLGKMVLGIKVVDEQGQRLSFGQALLREIARWVNLFTFNIGYVMAGTTRKKQALHDKLASTYVVEKKYNPGEPFPQVQPHPGYLIAFIVGEVVVILVFIMILLFFVSMIKHG